MARSGKSHRSAAAQLSGVRRELRPAGAATDFSPRRGVTADWRWRLNPAGSEPTAAPDPLARDASTARLEAVLFLSHEPINTRKLAQLANLADGTEARTLVRRLNDWYDAAGSAFRAEEVAGGFQLLSRPQFAGWLRKGGLSAVSPAAGVTAAGSSGEVRLSAPALETLAVVAYRQPVMRSEIEAIRGVDCGEILRQLMERGLVRTAGRAHELGRPYLYSTTRRFLQVFGLKHLDDLPRAEQFRAAVPAGDTPLQNSIQ